MGENVIKNNNSFFSIECLLPFFMLFAQYKIGAVSFSVFFLIIAALIVLSREKNNTRFSLSLYPYLFFCGYIIFCDIFRVMLCPDSEMSVINSMIEYVVMYFLIFMVCSQPFDEERLYRSWKIAGVIFTAGILYHVVQIYVLHQRISPISIIPGYVLRSDDAFAQLRPSSFFAEPAAFVNSMLPLLFLALKKNDVKWIVFCSLSILLSTSTVGIVLSVTLWSATILMEKNSLKMKIAFLFVVVPIIWMFENFEIFSLSQSKFMDVANGESTFGTRVLVGFEIVKRMSFSELVLGTRYNDISAFVADNLGRYAECEEVFKYWKIQRLFLNAFSRMIFKYGFIGLFLFVMPLVCNLMKKNYGAKTLVIMTFVAFFGQSIHLNSYFFTLVMIFMLYENRKTNNVEAVK